MEYKNLSIPLKQMLGYLVGILVMTILFSASIVHFSTILSEYNNEMKHSWRQLNSLQDMRTFALQVRLHVDSNPPRTKSELRLLVGTFNSLVRGAGIGLPPDLMLIAKDAYAFRQQTLRLIELKEQAAPAAEIAAQRMIFDRSYHMFLGRMFVEIEKSKTHVALSETRYLERVSALLLLNIILAPLSFAFLYAYGFFLSNYMGLRLNKFLDEMKLVLNGDYRARIEDSGKDEIGQIAQGINQLADRLAKKQ